MSKLFLPDTSLTGPVTITGSFSTSKPLVMSDSMLSSVTNPPWTLVTYSNSYVDLGAGYTPTSYYKDAMGIVRVQLNAKSGTAGATIFTLPAGYRPVAHNLVAAYVDGATGYVKFSSDGTVLCLSGGTTSVACFYAFVGVN